MAGKIVWLVILGIFLFSIIVPICFADEFEELYRSKENACQLIETGKFNDAKAAAEKMSIEYVGQEKLPEMLYWVAERFQRFDRFDDSKQICEQIIRDFPESPWAKKARLGNARWEATSLIVSGRFAEAKDITTQMTADFAGNPDLAETLYWISGRFQAFDRFEEAKQIYEQTIKDFPDTPWAKKANMSKEMSEAMLLIMSGKFAEANEVTDKMVTDFGANPDLPEMLYWISERYERAGRSIDAKRDYQRIIDLFPYSPLAKKAKLGIPRAEVIGFIVAKDFNNAQISLNKMTADFASHPDLPETLYWMAQRYKDFGRLEDANRLYQQIVQNYTDSQYAGQARLKLGQPQEQNSVSFFPADSNQEKAAVEIYRVARGYEDTNQLALAGQTYEKVIKEYPGTIKAGNAVLDIRRLNILEKMETGEVNEVGILLDKFATDFKQHPYACECLERFAQTCYMKAAMLKAQGYAAQAKPGLETAIKIWKLIINEFPPSTAFTPHAWFFCGVCYSQLGQKEEARQCYRKVADDWPDYELAQEARLMAEKGFKNVIKWDPNAN
jgi:TolA-binding protein